MLYHSVSVSLCLVCYLFAASLSLQLICFFILSLSAAPKHAGEGGSSAALGPVANAQPTQGRGSPGAVHRRHAGHGVGLWTMPSTWRPWTSGGCAAVHNTARTLDHSDADKHIGAPVKLSSMFSAQALLCGEAKPDQFTWTLDTS